MKSLPIILLLSIFIQTISFAQPLEFTDIFGPEGSYAFETFSNQDYVFLKDAQYLYRSEDGDNWVKINKNLLRFSIKDNVIVATEKAFDGSSSLIYTVDNGDSWTAKDIETDEFILDIAYDGTSIIMTTSVGVDRHLYRSSNLGDTWIEEILPILSTSDLWSFEGVIYASNSMEIIRYDKANQIWIPIVMPDLEQSQYINGLSVEGDNIIMTSENYVYSSSNLGLSWTVIEMEWTNSINRIMRGDVSIYLGVRNKLFESVDQGQTWNEVDDAEPYCQAYNQNCSWEYFSFFEGSLYLPNSYYGLFKYDLVIKEFSQLNKGLTSSRVYDISNQNDSIIWVSAGSGIYKYLIEKDKWERESQFNPSVLFSDILDSNDEGMVLRENPNIVDEFLMSLDYGQTWDDLNIPEEYIVFGYENIFASGTTIYLQTRTNRILISQDQGNSWNYFPEGSQSEMFEINDFSNKKWMYERYRIHSSNDNFTTYETQEFEHQIEYMFTSENYIFLLTLDSKYDPFLYYSTDGENWNLSNWDLISDFDGNYAWIANRMHFFEQGNIILANHSAVGLYASYDGAVNWIKISDGFKSQKVVFTENEVYRAGAGVERVTIPNFDSFTSDPEFELTIYAEDALGNQDSIVLGYDINANDIVNPQFGESEMFGQTYDDTFEARAALYDYSNEIEAPTYAGFGYPTTLESKRLIRSNKCFDLFNWEAGANMISIKSKNLPITLSWDNIKIDEECKEITLIDWMPGGWFDADGGTIIEMKNHNSYTFEGTEHRTISDQDTLYNLFFTFNSESVSTSSVEDDEKVMDIYPNPANDLIQIKMSTSNAAIPNMAYDITFYNSNGQNVMSTKVASEVSIQSLAGGLYFYRITELGLPIQTGKILKLE